ncbi:hypothetical protein BN2497_8881 [Janthinobacterium sp. CG23_2]|nr:hypothetical protein BN2497_8881 [Janthinobacterium sp. CG23_2]CUU30838.1 hypothetical protein BN3177_8881 [Janthinobacterium sp. CG23_2]
MLDHGIGAKKWKCLPVNTGARVRSAAATNWKRSQLKINSATVKKFCQS